MSPRNENLVLSIIIRGTLKPITVEFGEVIVFVPLAIGCNAPRQDGVKKNWSID